MIKHVSSLTIAAVLGLALAGCGNNGNDRVVLTPQPPPGPGQGQSTQYVQIERLSRPAIKEVFEPFQDHQISNAVEPYNDPTIKNDIVATENALRPPTGSTNFGTALATVLYPDEFLVNLDGAAPTAATLGQNFLSAELTGGTSFGGRAINDDVIDLELAGLFGSALVKAPVPGFGEDNQENNCLSSQNIGGQNVGGPGGKGNLDPSKASTGSFPYLNTPH